MKTSSHPTKIETVYIPSGALWPYDHNKGRCRCRECKVNVKPGEGIKIYTWNGWTNFTLCSTCARNIIEGHDFYFSGAFDSYVYTFGLATLTGPELAGRIWGSA